MFRHTRNPKFICSKLGSCLSSLKFSLYFLSLTITMFMYLQIIHLHKTRLFLLPPLLPPQEPVNEGKILHLIQKLRLSVTFRPLKDLRFADKPLVGHTWFMSGLYDTHQEGEVQYQEFPSESSKGRVLCLKGHNSHDGSWNYYALAWPDALPINTSRMENLSFISYNHYDYGNIWHGLSAIFPFVSWSARNHCEMPQRWVLYHWGEIRVQMGDWLNNLTAATFGRNPEVEGFYEFGDEKPVCFEKAVVMRHNEGGMSRERRMEAYDLMRCKARKYCNVRQLMSEEGVKLEIRLTLLMRTGSRSFKNETALIGVFKRECEKVTGCKLNLAYPQNLSFCEQVYLMSRTDIVVSPHGAQLTNMFLMDKNSSVMEFFPKGWLELAGVGQYVHQWLASWSGMRHEGVWRDLDGESCPFPLYDRRCMSVYKNGRIGFNETYVGEWGRRVLHEVKERKLAEVKHKDAIDSISADCACS